MGREGIDAEPRVRVPVVSGSEQSLQLSIVIPAFREARKIAEDIRAADKYLCSRRLSGEIIVVDDGSPDETARIAEGLVREVPTLRVISYRPNRGKGYALRTGIRAARGRIIMFADAGLCVPYDDLDPALDLLKRGVDVAVGSRCAAGAEILEAQPLHRRLGSAVFWLVVRTCFPLPAGVRDTQCGFKAFKGDVARRLYAECIVDRMMIDIDMLSRACRQGYNVAEFPVRWTNDPDTRFEPVVGSWHILLELARIWWDLNVTHR